MRRARGTAAPAVRQAQKHRKLSGAVTAVRGSQPRRKDTPIGKIQTRGLARFPHSHLRIRSRHLPLATTKIALHHVSITKLNHRFPRSSRPTAGSLCGTRLTISKLSPLRSDAPEHGNPSRPDHFNSSLPLTNAPPYRSFGCKTAKNLENTDYQSVITPPTQSTAYQTSLNWKTHPNNTSSFNDKY